MMQMCLRAITEAPVDVLVLLPRMKKSGDRIPKVEETERNNALNKIYGCHFPIQKSAKSTSSTSSTSTAPVMRPSSDVARRSSSAAMSTAMDPC